MFLHFQMRQHLLAPTPVSQWVSQSVSDSFRFGDSYRMCKNYVGDLVTFQRPFGNIHLHKKGLFEGKMTLQNIPIVIILSNWTFSHRFIHCFVNFCCSRHLRTFFNESSVLSHDGFPKSTYFKKNNCLTFRSLTSRTRTRHNLVFEIASEKDHSIFSAFQFKEWHIGFLGPKVPKNG